MKRILTLPITAAMFLLVAGCSQNNSLEPVSSSSTDLTQSDAAPLPVLAEAGSFVETFDNGSNEGGWSFATTHYPIIETTGGNPDWYVHDPDVQSFAPHPETKLGVESIFTGDYKARNVISVGIDLRSFWYYQDISSRYLTLFLMNDNGTPYDVTDDWGAYIIGDVKVPSKYVPMKAVATAMATDNVPGWVSYDFDINAQAVGMPRGWKSWRNSTVKGKKPTSYKWSDLMQDVSYVRFYYGDPTTYYIIDDYDLGLDNPRISWE